VLVIKAYTSRMRHICLSPRNLYPRHSLSGQLQTPAALPLALFEYWAARAQETVLGFREMKFYFAPVPSRIPGDPTGHLVITPTEIFGSIFILDIIDCNSKYTSVLCSNWLRINKCIMRYSYNTLYVCTYVRMYSANFNVYMNAILVCQLRSE